ncbi:hypothetical protein Achl_4264 (plasmid) [Pseudarthrobacter chlorophenolicus A6]|uniref:Uncharacterized protein n=1 Tax=Pseudarthrobacter chlorophenolicus (strain ATCC 700700 / DSM 12829 / CIP 107037 / JCM 12360 / KCTC 9906 / NCIMB 13794 / A6) TaxID=452863 RepID=B8HIG8_PSECP|nr:hypothetical protein [Pseudarthrobacter chlorophenolicus]ACL42215.1 hypothetical protein Achl_4264 [Pseudarthrobacter chlorophenolicus A6]SDQ15000.1 hypothetical protein SAMN04489738_0322 [Pseudarthrobacter chlorophenolicus]
MTTPETDPVLGIIGRVAAGGNEPGPEHLDLAGRIREALASAGWGDLKALATQLTTRAGTHDSAADKWTAEDRDQALIDSGIAAGYRGAAELAARAQVTRHGGSAESIAIKTIAGVLDQWQNGALVNRGGHNGIVWIEPLWPLPSGAEKIREALAVLQSTPGASDA